MKWHTKSWNSAPAWYGAALHYFMATLRTSWMTCSLFSAASVCAESARRDQIRYSWRKRAAVMILPTEAKSNCAPSRSRCGHVCSVALWAAVHWQLWTGGVHLLPRLPLWSRTTPQPQITVLPGLVSSAPPLVVTHKHKSLFQVHYYTISPISSTVRSAFFGNKVLEWNSVLTFSCRERLPTGNSVVVFFLSGCTAM